MKKSNSNSIIPVNIREKVVRELYKAGMNVMGISKNLNLSTKEIKQILGDVSIFPDKKPDTSLINEILYNENVPLATEVIIENEKARFAEYSQIEQKSLNVMNILLDYYMSQVPTGEIKQDINIAHMVTNFIKATHDVRQELLKKYEIDKKSSEDATGLKVEFI